MPEPGPGDVRVRIRAAGICHSDAHYRAGTSPVADLPLTPGHEVSGVVDKAGAGVTQFSRGDRVAVHYLITCRVCEACMSGREQFCRSGRMVGKHRDGGIAEYLVVPQQNLVPVPENIDFASAAIMMCSAATSFHALNLAHRNPGESIAVFGAGGLGMSAVQLARALGATQVFAVDVDPGKLELAAEFGAIPVNATAVDVLEAIRNTTGGRGVDISIETAGLPKTQGQAVACLAAGGRAALVGITQESFPLASYNQLINKEAVVLGVSDHLRSELTTLVRYASQGLLNLEPVITDRVRLDAGEINAALDRLNAFRGATRTVIIPD